MAVRTVDEYVQSLKDGRLVYQNGNRIPDVTEDPVLSVGVRHAALDYALSENPENSEICLVKSEVTGNDISRYFQIPHSAEQLLLRGRLIEFSTRMCDGYFTLIKEIGSDALFSLIQCTKVIDSQLGTDYSSRAMEYWQHCSENDLAMAAAITDVKGDRSKGPSQQSDRDMYLRIIEKKSDGIIVRGAKAHTTATPFSNEIIVTPTRALREGDGEYAVAFGIPANATGITLIARPQCLKSRFDFPQSSKHQLVETLTIFDDVFIPWERVFLCGEWQYGGFIANTFANWHRFTGISYKGPAADLLLGCAQLIARYNGVANASHIKNKISELITYTKTIGVFGKAAAYECKEVEGIAYPDPLLVNIGKHYFAENYHSMLKNVQEIAGGAVVTAPSEDDWNNPELRPYIEKYLKGVDEVSTENRLRAFKLIKDLTASGEAGLWMYITLHGEGSLEAQRITTYREIDLEPYVEFARRVAGIVPG